ncbi:hypothetical protein SynMITS9220_00298 [Synechococcus sp. MIT S9220]|nr:hypothetical protein SynMITS9220_00298 [Synechococcus sp. MIT S9220]
MVQWSVDEIIPIRFNHWSLEVDLFWRLLLHKVVHSLLAKE